jgi:phospholipase/carboxylesterase
MHEQMARDVILTARPTRITSPGAVGMQHLGTGAGRGSYLYVPEGYSAAHPVPLVLLLHGAGGHAHQGLEILRHLADDHGLILLAPASDNYTWDVIVQSAYGADAALIDRSLEQIFNRYAIDASRLAIGGFSDGASYALSLGLPNGELFTHIIAFSPGFVAPATLRGSPKIFISHGIGDKVLPIAHCSRTIVPRLQKARYDVTYHEFGDGHVIPAGIAQQAVDWLMNGDRLPGIR